MPKITVNYLLKSSLLVGVSILIGITSVAHGADPAVGGPWVRLHIAPNFKASTQKLAAVWGPTLPIGNKVKVLDLYGRWVYVQPEPLSRMQKKDFAKPGWVYNRMLLLPGDEAIRTKSALKQLADTEYFVEKHQSSLSPSLQSEAAKTISFLNSLVISRNTLSQLRSQDESAQLNSAPRLWQWADEILIHFLPLAQARTIKKEDLGFSGAHLDFLKQESKKAADTRTVRQKAIEAQRLKPPKAPQLTNTTKEAIVGYSYFAKNAKFPTLSHEEIDGHLYLHAVASRALAGCPAEVRNFWQDRPWRFFRVEAFNEWEQQGAERWFTVWTPGDFLGISSETLREIRDEAELAFVLVRHLVHISRVSPAALSFTKDWLNDTKSLANDYAKTLQTVHSVSANANLDVGTEIGTDMIATNCIASQGYHYGAGLKLLQRIGSNRHREEFSLFFSQTIGLDYRLKEYARRLELGISTGEIENSSALNSKRYTAARKVWNL